VLPLLVKIMAWSTLLDQLASAIVEHHLWSDRGGASVSSIAWTGRVNVQLRCHVAYNRGTFMQQLEGHLLWIEPAWRVYRTTP
jgi:hypothetical protein